MEKHTTTQGKTVEGKQPVAQTKDYAMRNVDLNVVRNSVVMKEYGCLLSFIGLMLKPNLLMNLFASILVPYSSKVKIANARKHCC